MVSASEDKTLSNSINLNIKAVLVLMRRKGFISTSACTFHSRALSTWLHANSSGQATETGDGELWPPRENPPCPLRTSISAPLAQVEKRFARITLNSTFMT